MIVGIIYCSPKVTKNYNDQIWNIWENKTRFNTILVKIQDIHFHNKLKKK